jgi:photosystem II stability/assembly factor-like uncharacterized protein
VRTLTACLLLAALVAGCSGRPQPQPQPQVPPPTLPAARADSLHVLRRSPLRFLPPLDKTLADKATVQKLYADLQAMPVVASDRPMNCPEDNGVTLDLTFKDGDSVLLAATADVSGCRFVRSPGGNARYGRGEEGQRFFADLAQALALSADSLAGFGPPSPPAPAGNGSLTANTDLLGLHMANAQSGWALGGDKLYRTDDSGVTWTAITPPEAALEAGGAPSYSPAFFLGADTAWVTAPQGESVAVFRTDNGGRTWRKATVPVKSMGGTRLWFIDADQGWLLVPEGAAMMHEAVALYHTGDGGATWNKVAETDPQQGHPGDIPFAGDKSGIAFRDAHTGWITGYTPVPGHVYLYVTHDGGKTWGEQPLAVPATLADHDMSSFPPQIFGLDAAVLPVQTGDGILFYVTGDGGKTWAAGAPLPRTQRETSLVWDFADMANGVVADGNRLWRTTDGGKTWTGGQPVAALQDVRQLDFTGVGCWALTGQQPPTHLRLSVDGCRTWEPQ